MKKLVILLLAVLLTLPAYSRNADEIISEFRNEKHVEYVNVGKGMTRLAWLFAPMLAPSLRGVMSIRLIDLDDCDGGMKHRFGDRVRDLLSNSAYEELATESRDNERSYILARNNGTIASEVVIAHTGDACSLIVFKGKIPMSLVRGIIGEDDVIDDTDGIYDDPYYTPDTDESPRIE